MDSSSSADANVTCRLLWIANIAKRRGNSSDGGRSSNTILLAFILSWSFAFAFEFCPNLFWSEMQGYHILDTLECGYADIQGVMVILLTIGTGGFVDYFHPRYL
jgi:hypothetical protein